MLSNAYFLAKIRFDTAENEPAQAAAAPFRADDRLDDVEVGVVREGLPREGEPMVCPTFVLTFG